MSGTYQAVMGDRGRLVVPAGLRERAGLHPGRSMVFVETERGLLLLTREQLRDAVQRDLGSRNLVAELLAERRLAAQAEDAS